MTRTAQAKPSHRRQRANPAMIDAILCRATGRAYTDETLAYLSGCDIENAIGAEIPDDATHVWQGTPADGGNRIVFTDGQEAFDWGQRNIGATVTTLKVERPHA